MHYAEISRRLEKLWRLLSETEIFSSESKGRECMCFNTSYKGSTKEKAQTNQNLKDKVYITNKVSLLTPCMGYVESLVLACARILCLQRHSAVLLVLGLPLPAGLVQLPYLRPSRIATVARLLHWSFPFCDIRVVLLIVRFLFSHLIISSSRWHVWCNRHKIYLHDDSQW